eukprot:c19797_g1_i3.p1 GENE.c19797_g1_i3~~c19797_g1_i3.p1  ORF type:complete len:1096 (+),score=216.34 c19797_g1_i3:752-4039(+)
MSLQGTIPSQLGTLFRLATWDVGSNQLFGTIPSQVGLLAQLTYWVLLSNEFSGTIPSQVGQLQRLVIWDLGENEFSGTIPTEVGRLTNLMYWHSQNTKLTGTIPSELGRLVRISNWIMVNNTLSGTIPTQLSQWTSAVYWDINGNAVTGSIPSEFGRMTNLRVLDFGNNQMFGSIPNQLFQCTNILYWVISYNNFVGSLPSEIGKLSRLSTWFLESNQLTGSIASQIGQLTRLISWAIGNNEFSGTVPSQIGRLSLLATWSAGVGRISGTIPTEIGNLSNLKHMHFFENNLTGALPTELGKLSSLIICDLRRNKLQGEIPTQMGHMASLAVLNLGINELTGTIPTNLAQLSELAFWDTRINRLVGTIPTEVGRLEKLEYWVLSLNQLQGTIPRHIGRLSRLKIWDLHGNKFTDQTPTEIGRMSHLSYWSFSENMFEGSIVTEIGELTNLAFWVCSNNNLKGTIPSQIGRLTRLTGLFMSSNRLSGSIPSQFANLAGLQHLDLAFNRLTGANVPGFFRGMEHLTLHHNQFSGEIPSEIAHMTQLRLLSLFDNRITGSVPPLYQPPMLLLFNNLLSCALPKHVTNNASGSVGTSYTLIALGNDLKSTSWQGRVDADWLHTWDSDSTHLFQPYPPQWSRNLAFFLACFITWATIRFILRYRHKHNRDEQYTASLPYLWQKSQLSCVLLTLVASAYMLFLGLSEHIHACANPVLQVTLAETLATNSTFTGVIIAALLHLGCCMCALLWLRQNPTVSVGVGPAKRGPPRQKKTWSNLDIGKRLWFAFWWLLTLMVLHLPTVAYLVGQSFPANNSIGIESLHVTVLQLIVSPWLVISAELVIPTLGAKFANRYYASRDKLSRTNTASDSSSDGPRTSLLPTLMKHPKTMAEMILASQLIVLAVAPIVSQVLIHDRCLGLTRLLWEPCRGNTTTFNFVATADNLLVPSISVLTQDNVCSVFSVPDSELCGRAVIASTSQIMISKVLVQTFLVLVRCLLILTLKRRAEAFQGRWGRFCRLATQLREDSVTLSILSLLLLGFVYGGIAPMIWPVVLLGTHATILSWKCCRQDAQRKYQKLFAHRIMWAGILTQVVLGVWFFSTV